MDSILQKGNFFKNYYSIKLQEQTFFKTHKASIKVDYY